jgi:chemotaxis protein methyltransferase CheR
MRAAECVDLLQWALPRLGLSWRGFRKVRGQVCKRIARRMGELGLASAADYRQRLGSDPAEWDVLDGLCRITISTFFRDRAVWERLRNEILPGTARLALRRGDAALACWSAGCASGEEPYGIAILYRLAIAPAFRGLGLSVVATDAEEAVLERARRACFAPGSLRALPPQWIPWAFERQEGALCLRPEFREDVRFRREDIRRTMPDGPFHVVLCRNLVFTYFDDVLQRRILDRIAARIVPGGVLVVGAHESLPPDGVFVAAAGPLPIFFRTEVPAAANG